MKSVLIFDIDDTSTAMYKMRHEKEMNQKELAKLSGTSYSVISAFEARRREPTISWIKRVFGALGYKVSFVLTRDVEIIEHKRVK